MNKALFLILSAALFQISAQTLDSIYTVFLSNNKGITAFTEKINAQKHRADNAAVYPAPELMLSLNQVPVDDPDIFNNAFSQELKLSQMFMPGGKLSAMKQAENSVISVIAAEKQKYILTARSELSSTFYEIWLLQEEINLQHSYSNVLEKLLAYESAVSYSADGKSLSILSLQIEQRSVNLKIRRMEEEKRSMISMLFAKAGIPYDDINRFYARLTTADSSVSNMMHDESIFHPSLAAMNAMKNMWLAEADASSRNIYPDFMLEFMLMRMPRGMPVTTKSIANLQHSAGPSETEVMFGLGFKFTLPFLPGYSDKIHGKTEEYYASSRSAGLDLENMQLMLESEKNQLVRELQSNLEYIQSYRNELLPLQKGKTLLAENLYRSGKLQITDVINEQKMLIMYEMEMFGYYKRFFDIKARLIPFLNNTTEIKD